MISLLIYLVTEYDIFEVVKNISSGNDAGYSLWEKLLVQLIFTLDVFLFTALFAVVFIYTVRSVYF
tara:strand:+ start:1582 stop:1779 length:198 start_codon:yes stop_codon:yes gene_type:complete